MNTETDKNGKEQQGLFLGILIIIILGTIVIGAGTFLSSINEHILGGIFGVTLGLTFIASYYFENKSFLFKWFMWFSINIAYPKTRSMALIYGFLCLFLGTFVAFMKYRVSTF